MDNKFDILFNIDIYLLTRLILIVSYCCYLLLIDCLYLYNSVIRVNNQYNRGMDWLDILEDPKNKKMSSSSEKKSDNDDDQYKAPFELMSEVST